MRRSSRSEGGGILNLRLSLTSSPSLLVRSLLAPSDIPGLNLSLASRSSWSSGGARSWGSSSASSCQSTPTLWRIATSAQASSNFSFIFVACSLITFLICQFSPCSIISNNEASFASSHLILGPFFGGMLLFLHQEL